jgi:hypothetical protein
LGCIFGPIFFIVDRDTSLLTSGLVAGTLAYLIDRNFLRKKAGIIG